MLERLMEWDRDLFVFLNSLGIERFDGFWIFVTRIDSWTFLFVFFILLLFYYYKWKEAMFVSLFVVTTFLVTLFLTDSTKEFVARLRPNNVEAFADLIRILQKPTTYSFFSGHASSSFSITTFMVLAIRSFTRWIYLAYLWPLLFVLSRIYVGVHYPSDILIGALVGTSIAMFFYWFCTHFLKALPE